HLPVVRAKTGALERGSCGRRSDRSAPAAPGSSVTWTATGGPTSAALIRTASADALLVDGFWASRARPRSRSRALRLVVAHPKVVDLEPMTMRPSPRFVLAAQAALAVALSCPAAGAVTCTGGTVTTVNTSAAFRNQGQWYQNDSSYPMTCMDGSRTGFGYIVPTNWNG